MLAGLACRAEESEIPFGSPYYCGWLGLAAVRCPLVVPSQPRRWHFPLELLINLPLPLLASSSLTSSLRSFPTASQRDNERCTNREAACPRVLSSSATQAHSRKGRLRYTPLMRTSSFARSSQLLRESTSSSSSPVCECMCESFSPLSNLALSQFQSPLLSPNVQDATACGNRTCRRRDMRLSAVQKRSGSRLCSHWHTTDERH